MSQLEQSGSERAGADQRLEESRKRLQSRIGEIGSAVDREVELAQAVRDGFVALVGVVGVLLAARKVAKAAGKKRRKRKKR